MSTLWSEFSNIVWNSLNVFEIIHKLRFADFDKVNLVQEACVKCFAVHLLKFEIFQTSWKTKQKHQNAKSIGEKLKTKGLMFFVSFLKCDMQDFKF